MSYVKTKGIVIKEVSTGEADKIVTIFTRSHGKVSASAKGARRPTSKLVAGTQFLCYSEFMLFKGKTIYSVNNSDTIEPFYDIRNDVVKLTYAAHFVDLLNDVVQENQPAVKVLQLFLNALHLLAKSDRPPELIARIFELRLLSILGYAPFVRSCMVCGKEELEHVAFSFKQCGFICSDNKCNINDQYAMDLLPGTARAIQYIVHARIEDLFSFNVSAQVLEELYRISRRYLRERLERDYTKLDFLKSLNI